jgi:hypothetical protein
MITIKIKDLFNNLNLSQKLFDKLKLIWNFTMISFPTYNINIRVDTPEEAVNIVKAFNPHNVHIHIKETNEQKILKAPTENTDQKPTE